MQFAVDLDPTDRFHADPDPSFNYLSDLVQFAVDTDPTDHFHAVPDPSFNYFSLESFLSNYN